MTPRVLISDKLSPAAVAIFKERGVQVDVKPGLDKEELAKIIGDYDGLAIRSATKVTAKLLERATKLKVVGRAGIGVDNVDIPAATARGVIVMNTPFGNSITTAEHAIALMFALARQIPSADVSTQAGKWEKNRFMGVELTGKTLGIIGCGNIGAIVASRALGLKMRVVAFDPFLSAERAQELGVEKLELDDLLRARRFHHPAHAADRADAQHPLGGKSGQDEARRSHHQLRPRRPRRRGRLARRARQRSCRGRGFRRLHRGAGDGQSAVRPSELHRHAASRRLDQRSAGERGASGRRANVGLSDARGDFERDQLSVDHGRGGAEAQAVHRARRRALAHSPASSRKRRSRRSRSPTRARSRNSKSRR